MEVIDKNRLFFNLKLFYFVVVGELNLGFKF